MSSNNDLALNQAIDRAMKVLQPMFQRPKLRSRLLSKPPFRFLHDIISAIMKSTDFPSNLLFTEEELQSSTFKNDKEAKIAFLDKMIAIVNASRELPVEVESRHIVAGVEAVSTLNLLVAFGELAAADDIDHTSLILAMRTEIVEEEEEETKVEETKDDVNEETTEDFAESKVSEEDDIAEETKDENMDKNEKVAITTAEVHFDDCSLAHTIDRIIQSASIIERLYTE